AGIASHAGIGFQYVKRQAESQRYADIQIEDGGRGRSLLGTGTAIHVGTGTRLQRVETENRQDIDVQYLIVVGVIAGDRRTRQRPQRQAQGQVGRNAGSAGRAVGDLGKSRG